MARSDPVWANLPERGVASRVPSPVDRVEVTLSGPAVGSWAIAHGDEDLHACGFVVIGARPEVTLRTVGRLAVGPAMLDGVVTLALVSDCAEFANSFEAAQVAIERLAQLPDARYLGRASMRIEITERRF